MELREKLINLRKSQNLTQEQLARKMQISSSSIKNYESPTITRTPDISILKLYADYFNVSYDYLLNDSIQNKTSENIAIEKILGLNDKAIQNLKEYKHTGINKILESKHFEKINNLIDFYSKFSILSQKSKELACTTNDITLLANGINEIITLYNNFSVENIEFTIYSFHLENLDDVYMEVIDSESETENSNTELLNDLVQKNRDIYTIFENATKTIKLELFELLFKIL